ncbi:MAG: phosphoglucosamine mutase [Pseudomonadota bacterium]|nr:phosphoglucosamine mutase [Pseudomonadota bacterium]
MGRRFFGTDGVRGVANSEPITPEMVLQLAMAAARHICCGKGNHSAVIGKDTRLSGYMLEPSLTAGFTSMGVDVTMVGPMPTPAVAMLTRSLRADIGVVISASHNPHQYNGIKLFGPDGYKLSDKDELAIEATMADRSKGLAAPEALGRARRLDDAPGRYIEFVKQTFPKGSRLDGLRIVVDCANGAAYKVAPSVFWELGADVIPVGISPDGTNINKGLGATNPSYMCDHVREKKADIGIALDGDADRVIIANEKGVILDGDQLMAIIAESLQTQGRLCGGGIVATVMSNLGLERFLDGLGLTLIRTAVGDRYVVEEMRKRDLNVGGEQSGHIILRDYVTTGDALIAALQVLAVLVRKNKSLSDIGHAFEPVPQKLENIKCSGIFSLNDELVQKAIRDGETQLGRSGRLVIRSSGTEPVVRVMAQGDNEELICKVVNNVSAIIKKAAS